MVIRHVHLHKISAPILRIVREITIKVDGGLDFHKNLNFVT